MQKFQSTIPNSRRFDWFLLLAFSTWFICCAQPAPSAFGFQQEKTSEPISTEPAAWEFRPYKVVVWFAHDNSWRIRSIEQKLMETLEADARQADPSGWKVQVSRAPNPWNWRFLDENRDRKVFSDELQSEVLNVAGENIDADKLTIVTVRDQMGLLHTSVQEFDLRTQVWGANIRKTTSLPSISPVIYEGLATAFMPMTRIEYVNDNEVRCKVRGIGVSTIVEKNDEDQWEMVQNTESPVWVGDDEIFMPVILKKQRKGKVRITPVQWTFLSLVDRDGPNLTCQLHSMRRVTQLSGRQGGNTERLALGIRAPERPTTLTLTDSEKNPLPDLEVFARHPAQEAGTENEFLGKTDWRGKLVVPANGDPLRLILIKSGRRGLAGIPVVPGLFDNLETNLPNDESRLYAEGITRGLFNELTDHVAQRNLLQEKIRIALKNSELEDAQDLLDELRDVPSVQEFQQYLNTEKQFLLKEADKMEKGFIEGYFSQLDSAATKFLDAATEAELTKQVREARTR